MLLKIASILWPSFLVAGVAEMVFFTLFDPGEMHLFGNPVTASRQAVYSVGFFCFWAVAAASSALTVFLSSTAGGPGSREPKRPAK
jgi:hypothetical protein